MKALFVLALVLAMYSGSGIMDNSQIQSFWTCMQTNCTQYWLNCQSDTQCYNQAINASTTCGDNATCFTSTLSNNGNGTGTGTSLYLGEYITCELNCLSGIFPNTWIQSLSTGPGACLGNYKNCTTDTVCNNVLNSTALNSSILVNQTIPYPDFNASIIAPVMTSENANMTNFISCAISYIFNNA